MLFTLDLQGNSYHAPHFHTQPSPGFRDLLHKPMPAFAAEPEKTQIAIILIQRVAFHPAKRL